MLSETQQKLIDQTYRKLSLNLVTFGERFYENLFQMHPEVRPLFTSETSTQSMKLMQMIGFAVSNMQSPQALEPIISALGQRHVVYGVKKEHYDAVGEALIFTLKEMLNVSFTPEVQEAWRALYVQLVNIATGGVKG